MSTLTPQLCDSNTIHSPSALAEILEVNLNIEKNVLYFSLSSSTPSLIIGRKELLSSRG
jgi:hypothetical protein